MTAIVPLLIAGAGLLLLSSRSKASAVEPRKYSTGLLIPTGKRKVRIERRKKKRAPLQPPLKPKEAAKRVRTVEAAAKRAKLVEAVEKLPGKRAATQLRGCGKSPQSTSPSAGPGLQEPPKRCPVQ